MIWVRRENVHEENKKKEDVEKKKEIKNCEWYVCFFFPLFFYGMLVLLGFFDSSSIFFCERSCKICGLLGGNGRGEGNC